MARAAPSQVFAERPRDNREPSPDADPHADGTPDGFVLRHGLHRLGEPVRHGDGGLEGSCPLSTVFLAQFLEKFKFQRNSLSHFYSSVYSRAARPISHESYPLTPRDRGSTADQVMRIFHAPRAFPARFPKRPAALPPSSCPAPQPTSPLQDICIRRIGVGGKKREKKKRGKKIGLPLYVLIIVRSCFSTQACGCTRLAGKQCEKRVPHRSSCTRCIVLACCHGPHLVRLLRSI